MPRPRLPLACLPVLALAAGCFEEGSNPAEDVSPGECDGTDCEDDGSGGAADGADDGDGDGGGSTMTGIPCDVQEILATHCLSCHDDPPVYGAPMPLVSAQDFAAAAVTDPDRAVHELASDRVRDEDRPMPPDGSLSDEERTTLLQWLDAGAAADADATCEGGGGEPPPAVGPDELPCEPAVTFTAHATDSDAEGFEVPEYGAENLYACFAFKSPLGVPTQATAWAPIVGDERVLHHWILYRTPTPQEEGSVGPCEMPSDAVFVSGWAPGGTNFVLPDDVGLELGGPDDWYILQIHYHNTAHHPDAVDASGVALCTIEEPREKTAGVVTLGDITLAIPPGAEDHEEVGTCPGC